MSKRVELSALKTYPQRKPRKVCIQDHEQAEKTLQEQPSEDLTSKIMELHKQFPEVSFAKLSRICVKLARWQKEQDIKLIQRTKDSWYKEGFVKGQIEGLSDDDKYQQGRFDEREQMMKGAQSAEIGYFKHSGLSILTDKSIERMPFKEGDKVKVIIVKENKK